MGLCGRDLCVADRELAERVVAEGLAGLITVDRDCVRAALPLRSTRSDREWPLVARRGWGRRIHDGDIAGHRGAVLQEHAVEDTFVAKGAWISHVVLVETIWVLDSVFHRTPPQLASMLSMLLEHESLVVQDGAIVAAALEHFVDQPSRGFSDCLILEIARKAGHLPLGTFDRDVAKLDGAHRV
jgi:predicted nucleic-acid-binding protein